VRHRVLDPESGRWLQRDPIGYAGGSNLYGYVGDVPHFGVDPMGLSLFEDAMDGIESGFGVGWLVNMLETWEEQARQNRQRDDIDKGGASVDDILDMEMIGHRSRQRDFGDTAKGVGQGLEVVLRGGFQIADAADAIAEAYEQVADNPTPGKVFNAGLLVVVLLAPGPGPVGGARADVVDDAARLNHYWEKKGPQNGSPNATYRRYNPDGSLKQIKQYDEFGRRVKDLDYDSRHGYHAHDYDPVTGERSTSHRPMTDDERRSFDDACSRSK
jgi:uncharacterized protein RhaS with RHS repeats